MSLTEKVAYLKGLAEGLAIDTEKSKEGKLIAVIMDILDDMALTVDDLDSSVDALTDVVDDLCDDMDDVVEDLYGDGYDDDDGIEFFEEECPNCGAVLEIDEDALDAGLIQCPACGQKFALDLCCDDDCGCDCEDVPADEPPVEETPAEDGKKASRKKLLGKKNDK